MDEANGLERFDAQSDDDDAHDGEEEGGLTLEELSQSYSHLLSKGGPAPSDPSDDAATTTLELFDPLEEELGDTEACPVTPQSILEAMLFVGQADSSPITAAEIAGLMRGVQEAEIDTLVAELNQQYEETGRATRIVQAGAGYCLQLAEDLSFVKDRFYGRVREVRLNQAAIDCLALVAYQPGISREKLEEQRGQPSGTVLNQLVRRQLLEIRREAEGKRTLACYYPTDRMLELAGLASLEDLPYTEDLD